MCSLLPSRVVVWVSSLVLSITYLWFQRLEVSALDGTILPIHDNSVRSFALRLNPFDTYCYVYHVDTVPSDLRRLKG